MTYCSVDVAAGVGEVGGLEVPVCVPVVIHEGTGLIVWQAPIVVPQAMPNWLELCVAQHSRLRRAVQARLPEYEVEIDWWLVEPGKLDEYPEGLRA